MDKRLVVGAAAVAAVGLAAVAIGRKAQAAQSDAQAAAQADPSAPPVVPPMDVPQQQTNTLVRPVSITLEGALVNVSRAQGTDDNGNFTSGTVYVGAYQGDVLLGTAQRDVAKLYEGYQLNLGLGTKLDVMADVSKALAVRIRFQETLDPYPNDRFPGNGLSILDREYIVGTADGAEVEVVAEGEPVAILGGMLRVRSA